MHSSAGLRESPLSALPVPLSSGIPGEWLAFIAIVTGVPAEVLGDRRNAPLKTLDFSGHKQYLGRYWRPGCMFRQNLQTGKNTALEWSDYRFKGGLHASDFDQNIVKRAR